MSAIPDSKVHGANMGPIWDRQDPGGSHFGPMNFADWDVIPSRSENMTVAHKGYMIEENLVPPKT